MQLDESSIKLTLPNGDKLLADGTIYREKQAVQAAVAAGREIQNGRAAARTLRRVSRKLGDLPEGDTKQLNAIAAILLYTGVGLDDGDIAIALGTHPDVVKGIKELDAYRQLSEMFDTAIFDDAKKNASHILAKAADHAAVKIVDAIDSPNEMVAVGAAREVLKMNGISTDAHGGQSNKSGLNIKIIRKGEKRSEETITVELNNGRP